MASKLLPDNPLTQRARKWKKDQGILSLTFDELLKKIKDKEFIAEQKVDGQSAIMEYKNEKARFASLGGRIITDIPVLAEIELILKKQDVKSALMVGELAGVENGKIILFDKTESLIKNPAKEKDALHWFPYQLLEINGEEYGEEFETYKKTWPQIVKLFNGAKRIESVKSETNDLKKAWESYVEKQGNEGLVVRTSDNKVYKCKSTFHYDLVVVAVGSKKGKNWPKKMIGNTLMAFMDENKVFRIAGEVGTGWTDEESKDLFNWAQKNKAGEDNTYIWVKPERIMEIEWERSNIRPSKAYKYENGKYVQVDNKPVGTIVKPRFIRYRKDKSVTPKDLRLTQIPDFFSQSRAIKKMARRVAHNFLIKEAFFLKTANLKEDIKKSQKSNRPSVFLGGLCENDGWRKKLKKEFKNFFFIDPYDPDWKPEENIYNELAGIMLADYVVFYKGGKGSEHEQEFMDQTCRDYKSFDDFDELVDYLKNIKKTAT
jgi:hypothetical protein